MTKKIIVQKVYYQDGQGAKGPWRRTDVVDAEGVKYSTFRTVQVQEAGEYTIEYEVNDKGYNDLKTIEQLSQTSNNTANMNRNNSIVRQHSQEMALRYYAIKGEVPDHEALKRLIDWFQKDVENTEQPF